MKISFARNLIVTSLVVSGVALWGGSVNTLQATTTVNTISGSTQTGSIPGEFTTTGYNNPTYIDDLAIGNDYGGYGYLYPLEASTISFSVTDLDENAFDNMLLQVRFFFDVDHINNLSPQDYDVDGDGNASEIQYEGNETLDTAYASHPSTGNDGDAFVLRQKPIGATSNDFFEVVYANGVTASDVSWILSTNGYQESGYTRTFTINFTISKVAKFSYDNQWTIGVRALNLDQNVILAEAFSTSYDMDWYGEIVVPNGLEIVINEDGTVVVDSDYADNTEVIENILFIANGEFDQLVGADSIWSSNKANPNGGNYSAYLASSAADLSMAQYFHMVVSDGALLSNHASAGVTVDGTYQYQSAGTIVESHDATTEAGILLDYYFYIKTSSNFQNATYTASVYFGIQNTYWID